MKLNRAELSLTAFAGRTVVNNVTKLMKINTFTGNANNMPAILNAQ